METNIFLSGFTGFPEIAQEELWVMINSKDSDKVLTRVIIRIKD
jgi:hypothetical protein